MPGASEKRNLGAKNDREMCYGHGIRFAVAGTAEKRNLDPENGGKKSWDHGIRFTTAGTAEKRNLGPKNDGKPRESPASVFAALESRGGAQFRV
jgi:hypothetical protein